MGTTWYYLRDNEPSAAVAESEIANLLARQDISNSTLVWTEGQAEWQPLQDTELKALIASVKPPRSSPQPNPLANSLEAPTVPESAAANRLRAASKGLPLYPLRSLFRWTRLAIYTFTFAIFLMMLSSAQLLHLLWSARNGQAIDRDYANLVDGISSGTGIFYLLWLGGVILLFSRFVFVAMRNLYRAGAPKVTITPGWAVGWNFIPIANLWKPFEAVKEIWSSSNDPERGEASRSAGFGRWWLFWLLGGLLGQVAHRMQKSSGAFGKTMANPDLFMTGIVVDLASSVALILSCIFLIPIFREITEAQHQNLNVEPEPPSNA